MTWAGDNHSGLRKGGWEQKEGDDGLGYWKCSSLCVIFSIFSPFASKVFSQYSDHSLQWSQHCSVDHHWPVWLTILTEKERGGRNIKKKKSHLWTDDFARKYRSATILKPLRFEMNNVDHLATVQYSGESGSWYSCGCQWTQTICPNTIADHQKTLLQGDNEGSRAE